MTPPSPLQGLEEWIRELERLDSEHWSEDGSKDRGKEYMKQLRKSLPKLLSIAKGAVKMREALLFIKSIDYSPNTTHFAEIKARQALQEFDTLLSEFHNDSTHLNMLLY